MASVSDICNLALSHLGDEAIVADINETSATADYCRKFYPIARDLVLEEHSWNFATTRADLALLATTPPPTWAYTYARPSDAISIISIHQPGSTAGVLTSFPLGVSGVSLAETSATDDNEMEEYTQEILDDGSQVIYTNIPNAIVRYVVQVTDTTKYTPMFVMALSRLLASFLAGPVIKGETGMKVGEAQLDIYEKKALPAAMDSDAGATNKEPYGNNFVAGGIAARR